jgi:glycosyltransferase involved in cell wall biosynthesis
MDGNSENAPRKRWIIISYFANIDGKAASQHIDDRLPHLESLGIEPFLITSVCASPKAGIPHFTVPSIAPSGIRFELRYLRRRNRMLKFALLPVYLAVLPFYILEKMLINIDSQWSWFPMAFRRGMRLSKILAPDFIYSTGGPASAHIAAALLSRFAKIPWVAELQDPLVHEALTRGKAALKYTSMVERLILHKATAVIYLTETAGEKAIERTGASPSKVHVIYPGAAPPELAPFTWSKGSCCRFAHFGSLGGTRNVGTFLDALDILFEADPGLLNTVRFDLYGTMDEVSRKQIAAFRHRGIITDFGKVSRRQAVEAMRKSDVLLLIQQTDISSSYQIPSKLYEYLQMSRPILGLVYRNPGLRKLLREHGHFPVEADSAVQTAGSILEILKRWNNDDLADSAFIGPIFTVSGAVEQLVVLFEKIRAAKTEHELPCQYRS